MSSKVLNYANMQIILAQSSNIRIDFHSLDNRLNVWILFSAINQPSLVKQVIAWELLKNKGEDWVNIIPNWNQGDQTLKKIIDNLR